jgi:hypothetical protein
MKVELGVSPKQNSILSLRRECRGKYLGLRERRQQKKNENYLKRSFMICNLHQILLDMKSRIGTCVEQAGRVGETINACIILFRPAVEEETTWESYVYFQSISRFMPVAIMFCNIRSAERKRNS